MSEVTLKSIDQKIEDLKETNTKDHSRIESQTTKTNGRVRLLEKFVWGLSGGLIVLSFLASNYVLPLIREVQAKMNNLDSVIQTKIDGKISGVKSDKDGKYYIEVESNK